MKLCITSAGNDLNAATDAAFGRAPWFVLVDTESGTTQGIENTNSQAAQGAGIAAAQTMTEHGVDAVLTGRLGPKARTALESSGIGMHEGLGRSTVAEALEQFQAGQYGQYAGTGETASTGTSSRQAPTGPGAVRMQGNGSGMGQGRGKGKGGCRCGSGSGSGAGRGGGQGQGRRRGQ
jgi:predicted Fe-Mo cluster-binding NifX family protein